MEIQNVFYDNLYLKELTGVKILDIIEEGGQPCVIVDKNIFYPRGGGQKGDRGVLIQGTDEYLVKDTIKDKNSNAYALLIMQAPPPANLKGQQISCKIDWEFRYSQMRLHGAVHLHHCMLEKVMGKSLDHPKTSDIQDGFAFNRYENNEITKEVVDSANQELRQLIKEGAEVTTYPDPDRPGFRWWKCLSWEIPCGGTHVANVKEVGELDITYSTKKGCPTINIKLI